MNERIHTLLSLMQQIPSDPFVKYALAMEYKNHGLFAEARQLFLTLEQQHPAYLPQYLMHGILLLDQKQWMEAKAVFTRGLALAKEKNDTHTAGELWEVLQQFASDPTFASQ